MAIVLLLLLHQMYFQIEQHPKKQDVFIGELSYFDKRRAGSR